VNKVEVALLRPVGLCTKVVLDLAPICCFLFELKNIYMIDEVQQRGALF